MPTPEHPDRPINPETGEPALSPEELETGDHESVRQVMLKFRAGIEYKIGAYHTQQNRVEERESIARELAQGPLILDQVRGEFADIRKAVGAVPDEEHRILLAQYLGIYGPRESKAELAADLDLDMDEFGKVLDRSFGDLYIHSSSILPR